MIRHVLSVKLIFFDFPSDIGPTFCGMGEMSADHASLIEVNRYIALRRPENLAVRFKNDEF